MRSVIIRDRINAPENSPGLLIDIYLSPKRDALTYGRNTFHGRSFCMLQETGLYVS